MPTSPIYDRTFFSGLESGSHKSAEVVVPLILEMINVQSVCDVGCGDGTWLSVFKQCGVPTIVGLDGDYVSNGLLKIAGNEFIAMDLLLPFDLDQTFDLVVSLEVAEHLPEQSARHFVESLTKLAPTIMFSAAVPRQGGRGHLNERWQSYWAELFRENGFVPIDCIRPVVWENDHVEWWYRQNTLVYCRENVLSSLPKLAQHGRAKMLSLMHPCHLSATAARFDIMRDSYFSETVKALPVLFCRALRHRLGSKST